MHRILSLLLVLLCLFATISLARSQEEPYVYIEPEGLGFYWVLERYRPAFYLLFKESSVNFQAKTTLSAFSTKGLTARADALVDARDYSFQISKEGELTYVDTSYTLPLYANGSLLAQLILKEFLIFGDRSVEIRIRGNLTIFDSSLNYSLRLYEFQSNHRPTTVLVDGADRTNEDYIAFSHYASMFFGNEHAEVAVVLGDRSPTPVSYSMVSPLENSFQPYSFDDLRFSATFFIRFFVVAVAGRTSPSINWLLTTGEYLPKSYVITIIPNLHINVILASIAFGTLFAIPLLVLITPRLRAYLRAREQYFRQLAAAAPSPPKAPPPRVGLRERLRALIRKIEEVLAAEEEAEETER